VAKLVLMLGGTWVNRDKKLVLTLRFVGTEEVHHFSILMLYPIMSGYPGNDDNGRELQKTDT
jgi:hypothetical protein